MHNAEVNTLKRLLTDPLTFIEFGSGLSLRRYQREVAQAVCASVVNGLGLSFVVMFPRQSGKNEIQAQIETYLLSLLRRRGAEIIKISPTWRPQSLNAMRRLERVLQRNTVTRRTWQKESGYIYRVGDARIFFLSGAPEANIVGATASTLLEVDEAQDVEIAKYDKDIAPMAAATNATRVFWGTAWTRRTLLARELRSAREAERRDGLRRAFVCSADEVSAEVPAYARFVAEQTTRLGRSHPMVRTQYFCEEIDAEGGMFPPERRLRMQGSHPLQVGPRPGAVYALLLDVAGEDEAARSGADPYSGTGTQTNAYSQDWDLRNPGRDATALTIVEVDLSTLQDPVLQAPTYRCVGRRQWVGVRHVHLYAELRAIAESWRVRWLAVDATGVGAGLAAFLERALPGRVMPFQFTAASKSKLGWDFLAVIDSGRWKEPVPSADGAADLQAVFETQLSHCQYEIVPGPEKRMRWGVPDGTRDPSSGEWVHDDLIISAALSALLDSQPWGAAGEALLVPGRDPLKELDRGF